MFLTNHLGLRPSLVRPDRSILTVVASKLPVLLQHDPKYLQETVGQVWWSLNSFDIQQITLVRTNFVNRPC